MTDQELLDTYNEMDDQALLSWFHCGTGRFVHRRVSYFCSGFYVDDVAGEPRVLVVVA